MLRIGQYVRSSAAAANATTRPTNHSGDADRSGCPGIGSSSRAATSSIALKASTIVTQLSQEKLPDSTSHSCVTTMIAAAALATGWGANNPKGTTSCAKW